MKKTMLTNFRLLCAFLLIAGSAFCADAPVTKGQRIYAAHHSYFVQVPPILTELAKSAGLADQVFIGTKYIGGSKAIQHWNLKDADNKAKDALNSGTTDVLILTPVYLPDDGTRSSRSSGWRRIPASA